MIEMMYLGKLMNVNAFDQPSVEYYKVEIKRILTNAA
jgi:glucose-6-phosphate isomerase